ncbi:MAG: EamA family transporter [Acidobacteria bacterium]|nr:EamA family transporter [Acidobacteriota bacterium]
MAAGKDVPSKDSPPRWTLRTRRSTSAVTGLFLGVPRVLRGWQLYVEHLSCVPESPNLVAIPANLVFGSLVGFSAYSWLLRVAPPSRVATHAYVNPLVAIVLGAALAGEPLSATMVFAGLMIAAGVALALEGQSRFEYGGPADA